MISEINIKESIKFYFDSDANENAINELVELNIPKNSNRMSGFSSNELQQSNHARLAAMKTQVDFWDFNEEVWDKSWGQVISNLQEVEQDAYMPDIRDFSYTWEDYYYKQFKISKGILHLAVNCNVKSLSLGFYFIDENDEYEVSNNMSLSDNWNKTPDDDERWTKNSLIPLRGNSSISIEVLQKESKIVMDKLKEIFDF